LSAVWPDIYSFEAAHALLGAPGWVERHATIGGHPLFVVDAAAGDRRAIPDESSEAVARFAARMAALPCVTVGVQAQPARAECRELLAAFDVVVDGRDELEALVATVHAHPQASLVFAQLLRGAEDRGIEQGLVAESLAYSALQAGAEFAAWRAGRVPGDATRDGAPPLRVRRIGATLHVELDRPGRHNAFSSAMRDALCEATELARIDPTVERVVLSGRGASFCSGGDLDEFGRFPDPVTAHAVRITRSPARALSQIAERLEARVHGACIGAGIELPAFAHRVVAAPDARFALPELSMGLVPGAGGSVSLPRRIGRQATAWLGLTGATLDAEGALAAGLVDAIEDCALEVGDAHPPQA
jgi:enoyl-CoA hydratase/carnithine racemase